MAFLLQQLWSGFATLALTASLHSDIYFGPKKKPKKSKYTETLKKLTPPIQSCILDYENLTSTTYSYVEILKIYSKDSDA